MGRDIRNFIRCQSAVHHWHSVEQVYHLRHAFIPFRCEPAVTATEEPIGFGVIGGHGVRFHEVYIVRQEFGESVTVR